MKTISPETLNKLEGVTNKEDVRIFRLTLLEENQVKILSKIEDLERKLEDTYIKGINDHESRIKMLEKEIRDIEKFKWIVIVETIAILGAIAVSLVKGGL